jgi:methionyl-tRNA formyltransferase
MKTKLGLMISGEKGFRVLETLVEKKSNCIGFVVSFKEVNMMESYYEVIIRFCNYHKIPFYSWEKFKYSLNDLIINNSVTEIIAISWKYKIDISINKFLRNGLIIFHDSLLPKYRGFTPTPTAIINGENIIGVSVIFANDFIDSGDIILQEKILIDDNMYIDEIIKLQSLKYSELTLKLLSMLESNSITSYPQDDSKASYSVWRSPDDCKINWYLSSKQIYNLIRAVSNPYPGAYTFMNGKKIYVWKSTIIEDKNFEIRYPGKIWCIDENNNPVIICGDGLIKLINVTDENMNKICFDKLRVQLK